MEAQSEQMRYLFEHFSDTVSVAESTHNTFPASSPVKRIDYILYNADEDDVEVVDSIVIGNMPLPGTEEFPHNDINSLLSPLYPSDHLGVVATLKL